MPVQKFRKVELMSPAQMVDELGRLQAKMSPLLTREQVLIEELKKLARGKNTAWDGRLFSATASFYIREIVDRLKVEKIIGASKMWRVIKSTKCGSIRVVAHPRSARRK